MAKLLSKQKDIFDEISKPLTRGFDPSKVPQVTRSEIVEMIREAVGQIPKPKPERIVERVIEKNTSDSEATLSVIDENNRLKKEISRLTERLDALHAEIKDVRKFSGDIIVPPVPLPHPSNNTGSQVIGVVNGQYAWVNQSGGGGGGSLSGYTVSNETEDKSFDADNVTLDELADVVGSIINDLQS